MKMRVSITLRILRQNILLKKYTAQLTMFNRNDQILNCWQPTLISLSNPNAVELKCSLSHFMHYNTQRVVWEHQVIPTSNTVAEGYMGKSIIYILQKNKQQQANGRNLTE
jgi:hypothetical protein